MAKTKRPIHLSEKKRNTVHSMGFSDCIHGRSYDINQYGTAYRAGWKQGISWYRDELIRLKEKIKKIDHEGFLEAAKARKESLIKVIDASTKVMNEFSRFTTSGINKRKKRKKRRIMQR